MQRTRFTLGAGLVFGLIISVATPAYSQVWYVESSTIQVVPVAQPVVVTRSFVTPRYSSSYGYSQARNNRTSAPAVYSEPSYLPEYGDDAPPISSRPIEMTQPVLSSRVVSSRSVVVSPTRFYSEPVIDSQPVFYAEPVVFSQPVRVYSSIVSSPRITREEIKSRPGHYEYEQKGKFEAFNGRRMKTYRYEYEVDQRHGRTKVKFDIDD